jgi:hypothetical protein
MGTHAIRRTTVVALLAAGLLLSVIHTKAGAVTRANVQPYQLSSAQRATLRAIAQDTWRFYDVAVDPNTNLPMDNATFANGSTTPTALGTYTSATNVGVYLWAVISAKDLGLITTAAAQKRISATLGEVQHLQRFDGFLYQWYNTRNGNVSTGPNGADCTETTPAYDNCFFISQVDNSYYAAGLILVRQAFPALKSLANSLLAPMSFGIFYDNGPETHCNVNDAGQPTGQMYGGYYVGLGPAGYHNGALYSDPRMTAYIGMGLHQVPGNVWWRSWRELPPKAPFADCSNDPDFSWQGQWPMPGAWQTYTDPQSGQQFPVWEGHYVYPGSDLSFIPTWAGGTFEALFTNEVVPETSWGPNSFGKADLKSVEVQIKYATEQLGWPVWGMSPSSTPDDSGNYATYGVEGLQLPYYGFGATDTNPNEGLSQCHGCSTEDVVTPHASFLALDAAPEQAYANIQTMRSLYPGIYGVDGFFDALNPTTGAVGHRYLVLDQSMEMAALDNALSNRSLQRYFAADPVSWAAHTYLPMENMFVG